MKEKFGMPTNASPEKERFADLISHSEQLSHQEVERTIAHLVSSYGDGYAFANKRTQECTPEFLTGVLHALKPGDYVSLAKRMNATESQIVNLKKMVEGGFSKQERVEEERLPVKEEEPPLKEAEYIILDDEGENGVTDESRLGLNSLADYPELKKIFDELPQEVQEKMKAALSHGEKINVGDFRRSADVIPNLRAFDEEGKYTLLSLAESFSDVRNLLERHPKNIYGIEFVDVYQYGQNPFLKIDQGLLTIEKHKDGYAVSKEWGTDEE